MDDDDSYLLRHLHSLQTETYALHREGCKDKAFSGLIKLIALSRMVHGGMTWFDAKYRTMLSFAYLEFKGVAHAAQAEQHGEEAKNLLTKLYIQSEQYSTGVAVGKTPKWKQNYLGLLIYFTLTRVKVLLRKDKEAMHYATKTKEILNEVQLHHNSAINDRKPAGTNLEGCAEMERLCPFLIAGAGFYPDLEHISIRFNMLMGRLYARQSNFLQAETHFIKALNKTNQAFGDQSKEIIPIVTALGQLKEKQSKEDLFDSAIDYYKQAYMLARESFSKNQTVVTGLDLSTTAYRLALCQINSAWPSLKAEAEEVMLETVKQLTVLLPSATTETDESNLSLIPLSSETGTSQQKRMLLESANESDRFKLTESIGHLQTVLIRQYVNGKRYPEAIANLKVKLRLQRMNLGRFCASTVETEKILLSTYLLMGEMKSATKQAELCLSLEEWTFGAQSKQARRTRSLLETLRPTGIEDNQLLKTCVK